MKRMLVMYLLLSSMAAGQTPRPLSLDEAIAIGKENSRTLRASAARAEGADARATEASTALLPSLKVSGSYRRLSDVDPFAVKLPIFPNPIVISPTILDNYSLQATVQQPLFTGFKLRSNARAAELLAKASSLDRDNDQEDIVLAITTSYWTLYQALETRRFVDENVSRLQMYQKDTENLMKAGLATRNDLLKIQVQLSNARLSQIDAANDLQVAMMNLNNAIGQPLDTEIQPTSVPGASLQSDSTGHQTPAATPRDLVMKAWQGRPDVMAMQTRLEASDYAVKAAQGNWWPQIFLSGNYYYARPNPRFLPARNEWKNTWDIGVVMQFDVWNWGSTAAQADQAKAALQANTYLYDQMRENVSLEVQRSALGEQRAKDKVNVARLAIEQAEENSRSTRDKFRNGLATSTDLLDASVALLQANTNFSGARVEYEVARARLARATGEMH